MSGDVVEKVARAIYRAQDGGPMCATLERHIDANWRTCVDEARAAIKALAESVSDEMVTAYQLHLQSILGSTYTPTRKGTEDVRASIRAALLAAESGGR